MRIVIGTKDIYMKSQIMISVNNMQKIIKGIVEKNVIRPSEKLNAKEVFIMVPGKDKIDLDKIRRIHLESSIIDEIIEGTEYGADID